MITAVTAATGLVVIAKVTVVALAGTVTVVGTVAAMGVLLVRVTTAPPAGAAAPSVTLPVLPAGPVTAAGLTLTPTSPAAGGFTVSVAVLFTALSVAAIVAAVAAATCLVAIGKVTVVALAGTVTETGSVAAMGVLLASITTAPPAGAAAPSVTLPVLPAVPVTAAEIGRASCRDSEWRSE